MLFLQLAVLALLLTITVQDMASRSVYWILFPVLLLLLLALRFTGRQALTDAWQAALINNAFLGLQLLLVTLYFSLKQGRWVNITTGLLGWGDILFLGCTAFYLSVLNFLFFYLLSLLAVLICWSGWQLLVKKHTGQIPLAGLQALLFTLFLAGDWWYAHLHLTADNWLLHFLLKYNLSF